ncbi:MAG: hypothetical protein Q8K37_01320 [Alphaproteobacteria bacterium]|nr:hypothetical protein [Alphaproteobacteria bacterium]
MSTFLIEEKLTIDQQSRVQISVWLKNIAKTSKAMNFFVIIGKSLSNNLLLF